VFSLFGIDNFNYREIYERDSFDAVQEKWPLLNEILHQHPPASSDVTP
jgi:hypothetical protein